MGKLDNMFERATSSMSGENLNTPNTKSGLYLDSSDIEILDYIAVRLCKCLDTNEMAFHGGYVLNKIIPKDTVRGTVDVDVSIKTEAYYHKVVEVLKDIGEVLVSDGIMESYKYKEVATEECSGGLDLYRTSKERRKLGADVGIRDVGRCVVPITLVSGVDALRFSVERMLADKMTAMHSDKRYRRTKDLYDFYIITNSFDVDVDTLRDELTNHSSIDWNNSPMEPSIRDKYEQAYSKLRIYNGDDFKFAEISGVTFKNALTRLGSFINYIDKPFLWKCGDRTFVRK